MKKLFSGISFLFLLLACNAQEQRADTIFFYQTGLPSFSYKKKLLPPRHLFYLLGRDPATEPYLSFAKNNHRASTVLSCSGSFLIGWQLGGNLAGKEINKNGIIVGAGLIFLALPFHYIYKKNAKIAASIYNKNISQPPTAARSITFSSCFNEFGATLKIQF